MDILKREAIKEVLRAEKDNEDLRLEIVLLTVSQMMSYYRALVEKGFNDEQALKIVIAHGSTPGKYEGNL